ncbi:MAG TPA: tripartite tricarboxylate transporter substrate binding protein [Burkholderiales bacterium]|nr:tripartite tricarboxylate transporter substrate binding protein [Burkholderiales bacterium]
MKAITRWVGAIILAGSAATCLAADSYPSKPIRVIGLSSPGSGPDIVGRLIGQKFTEAWGQQVIVDMRPAATGIVGTEIASRAAPDGYTLVIITSQAVIVSVMYDKLTYSLNRDFTPVGLIASTPFILAVNPSVPAASVKELIALAKSKPGQLRYGSGGTGSPPHLSVEIFRSMTGIDVLHVPYKGVTPAMVDTVSGQVQFLISVIPAVLPTIRSGKLRALAVTSATRSTLVPDLPTIAETVPGYEFIGWYSLMAPAKTPQPIVSKINAELVKVLKTPDFHERLSALGAEPMSSTPKEMGTYLVAQQDKMRKAVKESGAKPD